MKSLVVLLILIVTLVSLSINFADDDSKNEDKPKPKVAQNGPVLLDITLAKIGSKDPDSFEVKLPKNASCTRSIPATCRVSYTCEADSDEKACEFLRANRSKLFKEVSSDKACGEIYGGPQVATISITEENKTSEFSITRTDACQISLWDLHEQLWTL